MTHLFFDLDGTLTDPGVGIVACMKHAIQALDGPSWADADLLQFIGPPMHESFRRIFRTDDDVRIQRAMHSYRERFSTVGLYENVLIAGIQDALVELHRQGFCLWIVTSKPTIYAERIIEHFDLHSLFTRVYGSELSGQRSQKTDLLAHVLHEETIAPALACMIGDRRHDIEGAKAHGVRSLGVLWGYGSRGELETAGADLVVEVVNELPSAISRLTRSCS